MQKLYYRFLIFKYFSVFEIEDRLKRVHPEMFVKGSVHTCNYVHRDEINMEKMTKY